MPLYLHRLQLSDFRSYPAADIAFDAGPNVLIGPNGHGKTNVMEAVHYLATLGSHRVAADAPLVRHGCERAIVRASVVREDRELTIDLEIVPGRANRARLGGAPVPRPREILGALQSVLFAPEDLALVRGDPAERRRFLDELLTARSPRYAGIRADYDRVLKQRNALLKTTGLARRSGSSGDLRTLDVWDGHLAVHGAQLIAGRLALIDALSPYLAKSYDMISEGRSCAASIYRCSIEDSEQESLRPSPELLEAQLLAALARVRNQEIDRGVTLVGPHRDDLELRLGDLPAKGYASHGESWSYALALRLASYDLLRADGVEPILILDDVFAELDAGRRERLAELVSVATQVLVTAAVPADVPTALHGGRYDVAFGEVRRVC